MSIRFSRFVPLAFALAVALLATVPARGEDDPEMRSAHIDASGFAAPTVPTGPNLATPADLIRVQGTDGPGRWNADWGFENGTWRAFARPYLEERVVSTDALIEAVRYLMPLRLQEEGGYSLEGEEDGIRVIGTAEEVAAIDEAWRWLRPRVEAPLEVDASLLAGRGAHEQRLRALGSARLWPGRWTRLWLQKNEVPCSPFFHIEVAQTSFTVDPVVVPIVEGQELYLRFHPGESVGLVEVWSGSLEHLEMRRIDWSRVRNAPEANALGEISFPRTATARLLTTIAVPARGETVRRAAWSWPSGGAETLELRFRSPEAPAGLRETAPGRAVDLVRIGAVGAHFDHDRRPRSQDEWIDRMSGTLELARAQTGQDVEASIGGLDGTECVVVGAPPDWIERVRAAVLASERSLEGHELRLRLVSVPEAAWRRGRASPGRPVAAADLDALAEAGAAWGEEVRMPLVLGIPSGARVAVCEPGLQDVDCELAQESAGLMPITTAAWSGLMVECTLVLRDGAHRLHAHGEHAWVDAEAGRLELLFREPRRLGDAPVAPEVPAKDERASLPVLGGGTSPFQCDVPLVPGGGEVVLHAHVRGAEVVALLVSLAR